MEGKHISIHSETENSFAWRVSKRGFFRLCTLENAPCEKVYGTVTSSKLHSNKFQVPHCPCPKSTTPKDLTNLLLCLSKPTVLYDITSLQFHSTIGFNKYIPVKKHLLPRQLILTTSKTPHSSWWIKISTQN